RHESLRTIFKESKGEIRQVILGMDEIKFQLQSIDLTLAADAASDQKIKEIIENETTYAFDLSADSLVRAKVIKISDNMYVFVLVMNHII
ncbi:condensation domain-containing protein, partial [Arthrobacter sp. SIMBA_036]